jgi:hypothetical protein
VRQLEIATKPQGVVKLWETEDGYALRLEGYNEQDERQYLTLMLTPDDGDAIIGFLEGSE